MDRFPNCSRSSLLHPPPHLDQTLEFYPTSLSVLCRSSLLPRYHTVGIFFPIFPNLKKYFEISRPLIFHLLFKGIYKPENDLLWDFHNQHCRLFGWLPKQIPIVEIFWIAFSICLNCSLFIDLSATINPFLTKRCENLI